MVKSIKKNFVFWGGGGQVKTLMRVYGYIFFVICVCILLFLVIFCHMRVYVMCGHIGQCLGPAGTVALQHRRS